MVRTITMVRKNIILKQKHTCHNHGTIMIHHAETISSSVTAAALPYAAARCSSRYKPSPYLIAVEWTEPGARLPAQ